jgi:Zn-dependent protease
VRVRTYGFPGSFTRPPGTSTRDHPHEPTASKPVVPVNVQLTECSRIGLNLVVLERVLDWVKTRLDEVDAAPGCSRDPRPVGPKAFRCRVARPYTSVASLFAARVRVYGSPYADVQARSSGFSSSLRTFRGKPRDEPQPPIRRGTSKHRFPRLCLAYGCCDNGRVDNQLPLSSENPFGKPNRSPRKRAGGAVAGAGALAAKFGVYLKAGVLLLPKLKLLTTAGTALVSVAAYSLFWGWQFAAGFVVLLFIHEMGHVIQLRREGIKASTPMFIPFLGAAIFSRSLGDNALAEARVGLAGPVLGSIGAGIVAALGALLNSDLLLALAYVGFLINLFNLLPVLPLDGGRAMAAMAPWMWFVGFAALIPLALFLNGGLIIILIIVFGGREVWRRWQLRKSRSLEQAAYYRVAPRNRVLVGLVYVGLIVALAFGMEQTHVLFSAGHSFRSI